MTKSYHTFFFLVIVHNHEQFHFFFSHNILVDTFSIVSYRFPSFFFSFSNVFRAHHSICRWTREEEQHQTVLFLQSSGGGDVEWERMQEGQGCVFFFSPHRIKEF